MATEFSVIIPSPLDGDDGPAGPGGAPVAPAPGGGFAGTHGGIPHGGHIPLGSHGGIVGWGAHIGGWGAHIAGQGAHVVGGGRGAIPAFFAPAVAAPQTTAN